MKLIVLIQHWRYQPQLCLNRLMTLEISFCNTKTTNICTRGNFAVYKPTV